MTTFCVVGTTPPTHVVVADQRPPAGVEVIVTATALPITPPNSSKAISNLTDMRKTGVLII
jgi:hypothetical protein